MYHKAIVTNKVWYWLKDRQIVHCDGKENPETSQCIYGHLIYDYFGTTRGMEKNHVFVNGAKIIEYSFGKNDLFHKT